MEASPDQRPAHRRVDAILGLAERYLPRVVDTDGTYSDWRVAAPALVALCVRSLEAIFQLPPPRHIVAAETVTRSLVDYSITFAWLAAPTDEAERAERMVRFERDEFLKREQADRRYTTTLPQRSDLYRELIESGRMPSHLIEEETRARITAIRGGDGPKGMPPLLDRAIEADVVWTKELDVLSTQPLANVYASLYASLSMTAHASVTAVDRVVVGDPPKLLVGYPEPLGDRSGPYDIACSLAGVVLLIASLRLGWPPEEESYAAAVGEPASGTVDFRRAIIDETGPTSTWRAQAGGLTDGGRGDGRPS